MQSTFTHVYILSSEKNSTRHYTGISKNLPKRLSAHNAGQVHSTAGLRPWKIETVISFRDASKATEFERYLKGHSGRAFSRKRF